MDGFRSCQVDGDLLLRLTENELSDSIEMGCAITRKRWVQLCQLLVFCSMMKNELSDSIEMGCAITRERWVQLCQFVFCSMMKNELLDSIEMGNHTQTVGATVSAVCVLFHDGE